MRARTAVIIPAYNEQATIGAIVETVRASSLVDEVIVVSDGSVDATAQVAEGAGARTLNLPKRGGKAEAMLHGVAHSDADVVLFVDADLRNLTVDHIERLLLPVLSGSRTMNVGLRDRGPILSPLMRRLPLIGGERAMRRRVIEGVPAEFMQGFMVEIALNYYCKTRKLPYGTVFLPGLKIRTKVDKVGWKHALGQYAHMFAQVGQAMLIVRIARIFKRF